MDTTKDITHALSFDIEDWFHMVEIDAVKDPASWAQLPTLVEERTTFILRMLEEHKTKATFFILGWIAQRYPSVVRDVTHAGHEVASHGYLHQPVYSQTPEQFRDDLRRSLDAIAPHARNPIRWYRAPSFSITRGVEWAFDVMSELGFTHDASLFPAPRGQGGYACQPGPHKFLSPRGTSILELPMSVARVGLGPIRKRMCYSGGGYLRLLPLSLIEQGMDQERAAGRATVVYLHPRDFAPDCPRVPMPLHRRFRSYVGLETTESKLRALLTRHRWDTCSRVIEAALNPTLRTADNPHPHSP
jgi:polysaccharide deacetylase family protein (PEP-CTERM system associated)